MITRKELYNNCFGPKTMEAIVLVIRDEINLLRAKHDLTERTNQQIIDAISAKHLALSDYEK